MQIVNPSARILDLPDRAAGIALLRKIEWCARISHRSEDAQTEHSWERFLTSVVVLRGDLSVMEHATVTVDAVVDRGVMAEWTRHRAGWSYTVESSRFTRYGPAHPLSCIAPPGLEPHAHTAWYASMQAAERAYQHLLDVGKSPQIARSVLPLSLATRLVCTANLRAWRSLLLLRTTREAHPAMRQVMLPLLTEFQAKVPLMFDDLHAEARQADNLKKMR